MSKNPTRHVLIMGLPETGKTTFVGALWHVLNAEEVNCSLLLDELHGDTQYINRIRERYITVQEVTRTVQKTEELEINIRLKTPDGSSKVELCFPDLSGESFKKLWKYRAWARKHDEIARRSQAAILFIHPNKVTDAVQIHELELSDENEADQVDAGEPISWEPELSPTQVLLVELLQFLAEDPLVYPLRRLAVVISAWDVVHGQYSPTEWLEENLPLLAQFLRANRERLEHRIYGVSATGGDLNADAERLKQFLRHSERVIVEGEDCNQHDITAPFKWLMEL